MWSQEQEEEVAEKKQDLPPVLAAVSCWVSWNHLVKLHPKLSLFPQFSVSFVLFLCQDTLCKALVVFSFPDHKSH